MAMRTVPEYTGPSHFFLIFDGQIPYFSSGNYESGPEFYRV
jgi:hypothetical protein